MKSAFKIFILFYYSLGTLFLPLGDFSTLQDIPKMYNNCKEHEHHDMTPIDFITDHLINIDGLFDKHDNGDEQKPHKNIDFTFSNFTATLFFQEVNTFEFKSIKVTIENSIVISNYKKAIYTFNHTPSIFRPPIFV